VQIEPIAGITRHPKVCTKGKEYIGDKSYITVDCSTFTPGSKAYYFDLGASTWYQGLGGASQDWFYDTYKRCGVEFAGFFMWEAKYVIPGIVWKDIPFEVKYRYHWYNIPANPKPCSPDNPLNFIRLVAKRSDFVLLKIDIDNSPIEHQFIEQLLADPDLLALIDDFYFEHHVNVKEMHLNWQTQNEPQSLADTYRLFRKFREAGVRAHAWV